MVQGLFEIIGNNLVSQWIADFDGRKENVFILKKFISEITFFRRGAGRMFP